MKKVILILMSIFLFVSCSVVDVEVDYDENVRIDKLKTYAILKYEYGRTLVDKRVDTAINEELEEKGYQFVEKDEADFLILYRYSSRKKNNTQSQYMRGSGRYGYYGGSYSTSTYQYKEGTFEIRMVDPKTKDTFFRSKGHNTLESKRTPKERLEYVRAIVKKMLSDYPDKD